MQDIDELRAAAEALDIKVDRRWGIDRLRAEIATAQLVDGPVGDEPDEDASAGDETFAAGPAVDEGSGEPGGELAGLAHLDALEPVRAGGHVDRGDGRGWVLDSEE